MAGSSEFSEAGQEGGPTTAGVPEMTDLYRRMFDQLTDKFGGTITESNADAIAYVASELYHGEFEPRLWEEKSAHDMLDALGAPRAGVFAPFSLGERLLALQRRVGTSETVRRGHELLSSLDVPTEDEEGAELTLRQRIDRFRAAQPLVAVAAATPPPSGNGAVTMAEQSEPGDDEERDSRAGAVDVVEVAEDTGAAPLVEAVRALEEAARVEAEMAPAGGPPMDLAGLAETLSGLQDEVAAVRTLVESLATDLRERLEAVHEEILVLTGRLEPSNQVVVLPQALEQTADLPPVMTAADAADAAADADAAAEAADDARKRPRRRVLLVVLLVIVGLLIAGLIVVTVVYGWDAVRDEISGFISASAPAEAVPVLSTAVLDPPEGAHS